MNERLKAYSIVLKALSVPAIVLFLYSLVSAAVMAIVFQAWPTAISLGLMSSFSLFAGVIMLAISDICKRISCTKHSE